MEHAPSFYQLAMLHLLQIGSKAPEADESHNLFEHMYSIDIEELWKRNCLITSRDIFKSFVMLYGIAEPFGRRQIVETKVA
jgi:hypothetical protein